MVDFLTQTFAGAAGGVARAFKFSAMQDAEERRAERREESQIKLLMKRSEQEQIQAQQKAKRNEAFMTLQLDKRLESQRKINEANITSRNALTTALIEGRAKEGIEERKVKRAKIVSGEQQTTERILGREDVARIKAEATELSARIKKGKTPQDRIDALDKTVAKLTTSLETLKRTGGADAFTLALFANDPETISALTSGDITASTQELEGQIFRMQQEREALQRGQDPGRVGAIQALEEFNRERKRLGQSEVPITEENILKAKERLAQ